ncbi:MAG: STAS domain-containing protein [Armatimonadota bacterium]|nr:STAS domain-containing protein [Armatimonadota bacterium]
MKNSNPENEKLSVELVDLDGIPVVRVAGEIDLYNVSGFEERMRQAVDRGTKIVAVDLTGVSYLDSSGLSALIAAYKALDERDAELYVIVPPEHNAARRVIEITRLDKFICVRDSLDQMFNDVKTKQAA